MFRANESRIFCRITLRERHRLRHLDSILLPLFLTNFTYVDLRSRMEFWICTFLWTCNLLFYRFSTLVTIVSRFPDHKYFFLFALLIVLRSFGQESNFVLFLWQPRTNSTSTECSLCKCIKT